MARRSGWYRVWVLVVGGALGLAACGPENPMRCIEKQKISGTASEYRMLNGCRYSLNVRFCRRAKSRAGGKVVPNCTRREVSPGDEILRFDIARQERLNLDVCKAPQIPRRKGKKMRCV